MSMDAFSGDPGLPPELTSRIDAELAPGEKLVWMGQPLVSRYASMSIPLLVMGVLFTGFSVFWIAGAGGFFGFARGVAGNGLGGGGFPGLFACFPLFGVPFVVVGLILIAAPWWMRRLARGTVYAITDRRAIILEPSLFGLRNVRSYTASGLGHVSRIERADGTGDLVFEEYRTRDSDGNLRTNRRGFLAIANVRAVEDLLRRTLLNG